MPAHTTIDPRTLTVLLALLDTTPPAPRPPTPLELQRRGGTVLCGLLAADLPAVGWHITPSDGSRHPEVWTTSTANFPVLSGHAHSEAEVWAWAAHLGVPVYLRHGDTPTAVAVVDGIGVAVWCAPRDRDDAPATEVA